MTDESFCTVGGYAVRNLTLHVPQYGAWWLTSMFADLSTDAKAGEVLDVTIGALELRGTIQERPNVDDGYQRQFRLVGGAGAWGTLVKSRAYHSAAQALTRQQIVDEVAREIGETTDTFDFATPLIGDHYVRRVGEASNTLDRMLEGRHWWVAQDGVTHGGTREVFDVLEGIQVDHFDGASQVMLLSFDDPSLLWVGARIHHEKLATPQVVRDIELEVSGATCRARVFVGGDADDKSRMARALEAILDLREHRKLFGTYRYLVHSDPGDGTLHLQAARPFAGLPDVLPVLQVSGVAGALSKLSEGQLVRVAFDEGDPTMPYVAGYPAGDPSKVASIARAGDMCQVGGPGTFVVFAFEPLPIGPTPPVAPVPLLAGVPYLASFGNVANLDPVSLLESATPPTEATMITQGTLDGFVSTGSDQQIE